MNTLLRKSVTIMQSITAGAGALLLPSMAQAVDPKFAQHCEGYATETLQIREKMQALGCDVSANTAFANGELYGTLFDPSRKAHFDWCLKQADNYGPPTAEGLKRWRAFKECKDQVAAKQPTKPPKSLGKKATVNMAVDLYDAPGGTGNVIGVLQPGTVSLGPAGCRGDDWCEIKDPKGWAFGGPDENGKRFIN